MGEMKLAAWLAALPIAAPAFAQCELGTLAAATPVASAEYGRAIAGSGDYAAIGAPREGATGAVYVYERVGGAWTEVARLVPSDAASYASDGRFGQSVALSGATLLVGARGFGGGALAPGKAYVYERQGSGWIESAQLSPTASIAQGAFGAAVALDGTRAVIGAPDSANGSGAAYVFDASAGAWTQTTELRASDASAAADHFGETVALDGEQIVVGAPDTAYLTYAQVGTAYVFEKQGSSWPEQQQIRGSDPSLGQRFGAALALEDATLVVAAPRSYFKVFDNLVSDAGRVLVFEDGPDGFVQTDLVYATDAKSSELFGSSLALRGADLLVGVPQDSPLCHHSGALLRYRRNGNARWILIDKVTGRDSVFADRLGTSAAFVADELWTGVIGANLGLDDTGGVTRFSSDAAACAGAPCVSAKLFPKEVALQLQSGSRLSLAGDHLLVDNLQVGAIVWEHDGTRWIERKKLSLGTSGTAPASLTLAANGTQFRAAIANTQATQPFVPPSALVKVFSGKSANWSLEATITVPDPDPSPYTNQGFGWSMDIEGSWLVIGSPADFELGLPNAGSVYVYQFSAGSWTLHSKLRASDAQAEARFGHSVLLTGDDLWIGAPEHGPTAYGPGAVYRFHFDGAAWVEASKLSPQDEGGFFGWALAIDAETLAVGAIRSGDPTLGHHHGAVYTYRHVGANWNFEAKLRPWLGNPPTLASFSTFYQDFGAALALAGDSLWIGAPTQGLGQSGVVWSYRRDALGAWNYERRIKAWDGVGGGKFGASLALDGSRLLAGDPLDDQASPIGGAVYEYSLDGSACATLVARSQALSPAIGGNQDFVLRAPPGSAGDIYWFVGSLHGTTPTTQIYGATLPLAHDFYLDLTVTAPGAMPTKPGVGLLDANGTALAQIELPGQVYSGHYGLTAHHAYVVVDLATLTVTHVSDPARLELR